MPRKRSRGARHVNMLKRGDKAPASARHTAEASLPQKEAAREASELHTAEHTALQYHSQRDSPEPYNARGTSQKGIRPGQSHWRVTLRHQPNRQSKGVENSPKRREGNLSGSDSDDESATPSDDESDTPSDIYAP